MALTSTRRGPTIRLVPTCPLQPHRLVPTCPLQPHRLVAAGNRSPLAPLGWAGGRAITLIMSRGRAITLIMSRGSPQHADLLRPRRRRRRGLTRACLVRIRSDNNPATLDSGVNGVSRVRPAFSVMEPTVSRNWPLRIIRARLQ